MRHNNYAILSQYARHMACLEGAVVKAGVALRSGSKHPGPKDSLHAYLIPLHVFLDENPSYRLLPLGMPSNWQGADMEQVLDAKVNAELTDMLAFIAPEAALQTRKLVARVLLELADALVILNSPAEMMAEARHLFEIYLKDLSHRHTA